MTAAVVQNVILEESRMCLHGGMTGPKQTFCQCERRDYFSENGDRQVFLETAKGVGVIINDNVIDNGMSYKL